MAESVLWKFRDALFGMCGVQPGDRVIVAWSGGADSTFLTWAAQDLCLKGELHPIAVHVDHGLRDSSINDALFVRRTAEHMGIQLETVNLNMRSGSGIQERARQARYEALEQQAKKFECTSILTGHHSDDQAETVLMRVLRGAHIRGLRGILPRTLQGWARPMLQLSRVEILHTLEQLKLDYVRDPSNQDPSFMRVEIRLNLLPRLEAAQPGIKHRLVHLADQSREIWAKGETQLEPITYGKALDLEYFLNLPTFLHGAALEKWLGASLNQTRIAEILNLARHNTPKRLSAPGAHTIHRVGSFLVAGPRAGEPDLEYAFQDIISLGSRLKTCPTPTHFPSSSKWMAAKLIPAQKNVTEKKEKARLFERLRVYGIEPALRPLWPVLVHEQKVIGVAGLDSTPFPAQMSSPNGIQPFIASTDRGR